MPRFTRRICGLYNLAKRHALRVINNFTITHRNRKGSIPIVTFKAHGVLLVVLRLDYHIALHDIVTRLINIPTGKHKYRIPVLIIIKHLCRQSDITIRGSIRIRNFILVVNIHRASPAVYKAHIIFSGIRFVLRRIGSIFIDPSFYVRRPACKAIDILFRRFLFCIRFVYILIVTVFL